MEQRLIDADAIISFVNAGHLNNPMKKTWSDNDVVDMIESRPTLDVAPVVHGEWTIDGMNEYELSYGCIGYEPRYRCSICGIITESYLRTEKPIMPEDADFPRYCPNCGAKMDGKEKDDE